jgi:hypothetical protein
VQLAKASPWPFVGMGGLVCLAFLYGASALFLPWWAVAVLYLAWLVLFARACRLFTPRPRAVVGLAVVGLLLWLVAVVGAVVAAAG